MSNSKFKIQHLLILILIIAAYFVGLGAFPLLGPDEPRYAQVAREMFERNDMMTPTLGGFNWFEKPALAYWVMIVGYKLFGISEFAARCGSAMFGLLTILTIYLLCRKFSAENPEEQREENNFADWAMLVSASNIGLLFFSHAASFDIILTFPVTAALACFFISQNFSPSPRRSVTAPLAGFYFFIGVALLAKGLIGAILPFGIVFCYFAAMQKLPDKTFIVSLFWGSLLTVVVAGTWYLPMYWQHGWQFIDEFFIQHHFARYTSNKYVHPEPFWFFWAILPLLLLPWTPFLIAAIWNFISRKGAKVQSQLENNSPFLPFFLSPFHNLRIFALVWLLVPLVFFSFSGSKLPGYILPALPAAVLLAVEQIWRSAANKKFAFGIKYLSLLILLAVPLFLLTFGESLTRHETTKFLIQQANDRGFDKEKVLNLHDISHSLEFYAAGRLARTADGKQIKFEGLNEILIFLRESSENQALILVPLKYEFQLTESDLITADKIADNGVFSLVAITEK